MVNSSDLGVRQPETAAVKAGQAGSGEIWCWATVVGSRAAAARGVSPSGLVCAGRERRWRNVEGLPGLRERLWGGAGVGEARTHGGSQMRQRLGMGRGSPMRWEEGGAAVARGELVGGVGRRAEHHHMRKLGGRHGVAVWQIGGEVGRGR